MLPQRWPSELIHAAQPPPQLPPRMKQMFGRNCERISISAWPEFRLISLFRFQSWPDYTPHSFCPLSPPTPRAALTLELKRPSCRRVSSPSILLKTSDRSTVPAAVSPSWQTIDPTRRRAAVRGTLFLYGLSSQKGENSIYTTCTNALHYLNAIRWCMTIKSPAETFFFFFFFLVLPESSACYKLILCV